jgi:hypothetical protein
MIPLSDAEIIRRQKVFQGTTPPPSTTTADSSTETPAETNFDSMQLDFTQPNLPETKSTWAAEDTIKANKYFAAQGSAKTLILIAAAGIALLLFFRVLKKQKFL